MKNNFSAHFFSSPFVYTRLRPLLYLGLDYSKTFSWLNENSKDVILDIGCGAGDSLRYIKNFQHYHGFDVNPVMLGYFQKTIKDPRIQVYPRKLIGNDLKELNPTKAIMIGLLHHLDDTDVDQLLTLLLEQHSISRLITLDTVYVKGKYFNNFISSFDRGKFVRHADGFRKLIKKSGWTISEEDLSTNRTGNPFMYLYSTCLVRQ